MINAQSAEQFLLITEADLEKAKNATGKDFADSPEEFREYLWKTLTDITAYEESIFRWKEQTILLKETRDAGLKDAVVSADRTRTACHNGVIDDLTLLNRLCGWVGIPEILPGISTMQRRDIAMAAFELQHHMAQHCY